jgi:hypothetical protein
MSTSRESSVWRSLAVAFGDGLAFGVGMKLTQNAATRPTASPSTAIAKPSSDRLGQLEERIRRIERTPVALPAGTASAPTHFDQNVLDALVNAVETRLQEQAAATERRMADLEARLAVELKTLHEDVRALAAGADTRIRETHAAFDEQVATTRREIADLATGRRNDAAAIAGGLEKLGQRMVAMERNAATGGDAAEQHVAAMAAKVDQVGKTLLEGYETLRVQVADFDRKGAVIEARFTSALASQAEKFEAVIIAGQDQLRAEIAELDGRVGTIASALAGHEHEALQNLVRQQIEAVRTEMPQAVETAVAGRLEAALAEKDRLIAQLQAAAVESEVRMATTLQSIGNACLEAAKRPEPAPEPAPPPATPEVPEELPEPKPANGTTEMQPSTLFESGKPARVWRIPLVSSFLACAAGIALLRFVM